MISYKRGGVDQIQPFFFLRKILIYPSVHVASLEWQGMPNIAQLNSPWEVEGGGVLRLCMWTASDWDNLDFSIYHWIICMFVCNFVCVCACVCV